MNEIQQLKKEFNRHKAMTGAKFEFLRKGMATLSEGFKELKDDNDLFYDRIFDIMDELDADLKNIKSRLDQANL